MTLEEEGVYIRLLCYCWSAGSIPADPERCARLAGKGCSVETATTVQRAFNEDPTDDQRLVHDRLEIERTKQNMRREQASEAGKKSAEVRLKIHKKTAKNRKVNDRSTSVQRKVNPSSSSSSSSSSSEEEEIEASPLVANATPPAVGTKRESAPIAFIAEQFAAAFGGRVHITAKRIKAANARWQDSWWRENWHDALDHGSGCAFLRGENDRGWKCTLDWFLRPDSATAILEGKYDGAGKPRQQTAAERREQLNASSFDLIRQAAAAAAAEREAANASSGNCRIEVSPGT